MAPTNNNNQRPTNQTQSNQPLNQDALVQKVVDRVWELWREDLRRERERRGHKRGS